MVPVCREYRNNIIQPCLILAMLPSMKVGMDMSIMTVFYRCPGAVGMWYPVMLTFNRVR